LTSFCFGQFRGARDESGDIAKPAEVARELLEQADSRRGTGRCGNRLLSPGQQLIDQRFVPRFRAVFHRLQLEPLDRVHRDRRRRQRVPPLEHHDSMRSRQRPSRRRISM
jgi:hypothetical protein